MFWLAMVIIAPMMLAYWQTLKQGEIAIRAEAERVAQFLTSEVDRILGETERTMDDYLHRTSGSCLPNDLEELHEFSQTSRFTVALGIVAPDGTIACSVGSTQLSNLSFPESTGERLVGPQFSEVQFGSGALPVVVKHESGDLRMFAVVSPDPFQNLLLPKYVGKYAQVDVLLPGGGHWYSLLGTEVSFGLMTPSMSVVSMSNRFPVTVNIVLDEAAAQQWSGSLGNLILVITLFSIAVMVLICILAVISREQMKRSRARLQRRLVDEAWSLFDVRYQPLINLEDGLLTGAVAKADFSLFDNCLAGGPTAEEFISMVWHEIGEFASARREFKLVIEIDGRLLLKSVESGHIVDILKRIKHDDLVLLVRWKEDKGVDPSLYARLEDIEATGAKLAIDCGSVRFSLVADMWAWPYHVLVVDYATLPDSEDAQVWVSDRVVELGVQLQLETLAIGLDDALVKEFATDTGIPKGAGDIIGPALPLEAFLSVVRPVPPKVGRSKAA